MHITDVAHMKVADLKRELKVRGLSIAGNKNELQDRLQVAMEGEPLLEDGSLVGEDILDEEGVLSDEEKILGSDENELLKSPTTTPITILTKTLGSENKDSASVEDDILESPTNVTKKIVLKRTSLDNNASTTKENTEPAADKPVKMSERNPITMGEAKKVDVEETGAGGTKKLKELSMQERLELRAKKFGIDAKTTATTPITAKEKNGAISAPPVLNNEKQVELLKKRAERFGCVTSTNLAKLDAEERLLKRKQRFGGETVVSTKVVKNDSSSTIVTKSSSDNDEWAEKARKRLERFKGNVTPTVSVPATSEVSAASTAPTAATSA